MVYYCSYVSYSPIQLKRRSHQTLRAMPFNHNHSLLSKAVPFISQYLTFFDIFKIGLSFAFLFLSYLNFISTLPSTMLVMNLLCLSIWPINFTLLFDKFSTFTYLTRHHQTWLPLDSAYLCYCPNPHFNSF